MASKFENKMTRVNGIAINPANMNADGMVKPENFTCEIPYTRVINASTIEAVKKAMNYDASVMVSITELQNEKAQPKRYSNGKIFESAREIFVDEETAKAAVKDGEIVRKFNMYAISAQIWTLDNSGEYHTHSIIDETPVNMTKLDMVSFMKMSGSDLYGEKVIGVHGSEKTELEKFAVITPEQLEKCVIKPKQK